MDIAANDSPKAEIFQADSGLLTLRYGSHWLEDPKDPLAASRRFVHPHQLAGAQHVVLFGAGLGYRPLWLQQLRVPHLVLFDVRRRAGHLNTFLMLVPTTMKGAIQQP